MMMNMKKTVKKVLAFAVSISMAMTIVPVATGSYASAASNGVSPYKVQDRLTQLASLNGKYFTTNGKKSGNSNNREVLKKNGAVRALNLKYKGARNVSSYNNIPGHFDWSKKGKGNIYSNAWQCAGFANYAEWFIYADSYKTKVKVRCVKQNVAFKYAGMSKYARPGDVVRTNKGHPGHSMVIMEVTKKYVKVIDNNWGSNNKIAVHKIYYTSGYAKGLKVGITRATTYAATYNHTFSYDCNGGAGSVGAFTVGDNKTFTMTQAAPSKNGCIFRGWAVKRLRDQTWFSNGNWTNKPGAYTLYTSKKTYNVNGSWRKGATSSIKMNDGSDSSYRFVAIWSNRISPDNLGSDFTTTFRSKISGKNLTVSGSNVQTASSNNNGDSYQKWRFTRQSNGSYKITNVGSGKVLDAYGARSVNGTNIQVAANNNTTAQRWYVCAYNDGYVLVPVYCDLMMDVDSNSKTNVQLWGNAATGTMYDNRIFYIGANSLGAKSVSADESVEAAEEPEVIDDQVQPEEETVEQPAVETEEPEAVTDESEAVREEEGDSVDVVENNIETDQL